MKWIIAKFKWIMLVTGVLTASMFYYAIAPNAALGADFGHGLDGPLAERIVRKLAERNAQRRAGVAVPIDLPSAVVVSPSDDTLGVGEHRQLVANAHSSSGTVIPNRIFMWSSSNDAIASVTNAGLVTAHAAGTVVIAANTANVVGTTRIIVTAPR